VNAAPLFAFVQFDFPGPLGLEEGRYVVRAPGTDTAERILVIADALAPAHLPRRAPRRKARAQRAEERPPDAPIRRLTVIEADSLAGPDEAAAWLKETKEEEAAEAQVAEALGVVNHALHAAALAAADPHPRELGVRAALAIRVGYGSGDEVAEGRWADALELPGLAARRERRADVLRSDERFAAIIGGREAPSPAETLLLRARADHDAGRERELALQLRAAVEALLVEPDPPPGLADRKTGIEGAARAAAAGSLDDTMVAELVETLEICERAMRRRAVERE
jgi:hypothetical protein